MSKSASAAQGHPDEPATKPAIPGKLYFRIGEASRILGVPPHVLRYWETEFPSLAPRKSPGGQRMYRRKDLELLLLIKHLLYERKFTIAGARQWLAERARRRGNPLAGEQGRLFADPMATLEQVRRELAELIEMLK
ncbi:MAG: MerR family transcriptional regulator [Bryobacterales bacterium]|nr:MerR family transcriptional regulator [Bryobacteraceae bacterium]MDW8129605.1 MerR family transcriptional regulator [Bryobacterales bacterium]